MKLNVGKKSGFVVTGKRLDLFKVAKLPGARFMVSEQCVRLPEHIASWRGLNGLEFDFISKSARLRLEALEADYRASRRNIRNATRKFKKSSSVDIPVPLKSNPYEHQVRAFGFSTHLDGSALFMDQGTGKTMVAVAIAGQRMLNGEAKRVLVVCPKAVKPVWPREFAKHADFPFTYEYDKQPDVADGVELWITNYDRLKRELKKMLRWKPDMVIFDESHKIKNRKSDRTKAAISLSDKVKYKMVLSGTPFAKCISEVWSQMRVVDDRVFGRSYSQFKSRYLQMGGYMQYEVVGYNNEEEFSRKMHEKAFRVKKEECLDLPEMNYQHLYVQADVKTRKIYEQMERELFLELQGEEISADSAAVLNMKLRQIVGGAVKTDNQEMAHTSKLKMGALSDLLEGREGNKTVVFFSFTHEIVLAQQLAKKLKLKYLTLQGSTPDEDKLKFEDRFQNGDYDLAFINIQCGAEGITLTAADMVVFFSPTFSFIGFSQAKDRIHRIGQEKKSTCVFIIMEKTVDERVVSVLECNGQLVDTYLNNNRNYKIGDHTMATKFTVKDIAEATGLTPAEVRKHLRGAKVEKPEAGWEWTKKSDLNAVIKAVKDRAAALEGKGKAPGKAGDGKAKGKAAKREKSGKSNKKAPKDTPAEEEAGDDFESMDKDALLAYADENEIKVPAAKKRSLKGLRTFLADAASKK